MTHSTLVISANIHKINNIAAFRHYFVIHRKKRVFVDNSATRRGGVEERGGEENYSEAIKRNPLLGIHLFFMLLLLREMPDGQLAR